MYFFSKFFFVFFAASIKARESKSYRTRGGGGYKEGAAAQRWSEQLPSFKWHGWCHVYNPRRSHLIIIS